MPCAGRTLGHKPQREPILQNPSSMPDLDAPPPAPPAGGDSALAQVSSDIKAVQQQALATQRTIDQLQAQHEAPAHADTWSTTTVLSAAGWGVASALTLAIVFLVWRSRSKPPAPAHAATRDAVTSDFGDDPISMFALKKTAQEEEISQWAPQPETAEDRISDWGAIPLVHGEPAPTFDLQAATSEVSRVRTTLAQRRQERALQRERDAQQLREAAQQAAESALMATPPDVSHKGVWVPDLDLSQDIIAQAPPAPPAPPPAAPEQASIPVQDPFTEPATDSVPMAHTVPPQTQLETPPMNIKTRDADPVKAPTYRPPAARNSDPVNVHAVKLALAHEAEAKALWADARALAQEALASPDAALNAQAQATLGRLAHKMQSEGDTAVPAMPPSVPSPPLVQAPPPIAALAQEPEPLIALEEDVYAVKLALAQESEAIELWDEARELAEEVLASPDPALTAQAKALLAEIAQKLDAIAQDGIAFDVGSDSGAPKRR